jgi:leader peptidase (prepilin peptidase)/N-methyltransferase
MVELMTGILFLSCVLHFGVTLTAVKFCVFSFLILGLIFTDADTQLLPDTLTLPGLWIGLLFSLFVPVNGLLSLLYMAGLPHIPFWAGSLLNAAVSAAFGAGFIYIVGEAWYRLRGIEAMGFGDVKLMGMIGAFLGAKLVLLTILFGSLSGSIIGLTMAAIAHRKRMRRWRNSERAVARARAQHAVDAIMRRYPIPFGVFLGMGALVSAFFGPDLIAWYTRQFL